MAAFDFFTSSQPHTAFYFLLTDVAASLLGIGLGMIKPTKEKKKALPYTIPIGTHTYHKFTLIYLQFPPLALVELTIWISIQDILYIESPWFLLLNRTIY